MPAQSHFEKESVSTASNKSDKGEYLSSRSGIDQQKSEEEAEEKQNNALISDSKVDSASFPASSSDGPFLMQSKTETESRVLPQASPNVFDSASPPGSPCNLKVLDHIVTSPSAGGMKMIGSVSSSDNSQSPIQTETTSISPDDLSDSDSQDTLEDKRNSNNELVCSSSQNLAPLSKDCYDKHENSEACLDVAPEEQLEETEDENNSRAKLAIMAKKLVEKWEGLKEVFRIPKRAAASASKVSTTIFQMLCNV